MPRPTAERITLAFVIFVLLAALVVAVLTPGFAMDNTVVYQGF